MDSDQLISILIWKCQWFLEIKKKRNFNIFPLRINKLKKKIEEKLWNKGQLIIKKEIIYENKIIQGHHKSCVWRIRCLGRWSNERETSVWFYWMIPFIKSPENCDINLHLWLRKRKREREKETIYKYNLLLCKLSRSTEGWYMKKTKTQKRQREWKV